MAAAQKRMDRLANNLANLETTAYKRQTSFIHALSKGAGNHSELHVGTKFDFSQGELEPTGNALHVALDGEGFFGVEGEDGEVYTRNGAFQVDENGTILSHAGLPVAWAELRGVLDPTGERIEIGTDGGVSQGGRSLGRLRIANFADLGKLSQDTNGYYHAPLGLEETAHTATVHQGALEGSNVSPIEEMVAMIAVQRSFSGATNILGLISETYRRLSRI